MSESEAECLHCEINKVVQRHIEEHERSNLPDLVARISESLVDLILLGPEEQWGSLLAEAMRQIGDAYLEKSGVVETETAH